MAFKILKAISMWTVIACLYIAAKIVRLDFIFNFLVATFFIPVISKIINNEHYNQLALKQECLRAVYDLAKYLKAPISNGRPRPIADSYPALDKAVQNSGIFTDDKISTIMYDFYDAIHDKDHERINSVNIEYIKQHLQEIIQKTSLPYYLVYEVAKPIAIDLPSQIFNISRYKKQIRTPHK